MRRSKRFKALESTFKEESYNLPDAVKLVKELSNTKFDETIEIAVKLGINYKQEHVRGTAFLPYGTGKTKRVLVFAEGEKAKEASEAGADFVGTDEYLKKISDGWLEFDSAIAAPDVMPKVSKLGKILGPRGLMPNPKAGTVTQEVSKAVKDIKCGKIEFKMDKGGSLHCPVGKASFEEKKLEENIVELLKSIWEAKPATCKKNYFKNTYLCSTMGPSIKLSPTIANALKK